MRLAQRFFAGSLEQHNLVLTIAVQQAQLKLQPIVFSLLALCVFIPIETQQALRTPVIMNEEDHYQVPFFVMVNALFRRSAISARTFETPLLSRS